ncbi:MAG: TIGR03905 family TSCPD domain-containing protein [Clostridia bacterium]|nr:TIGR03905 family TSCPD domain-containing protein [Clostridia bacterium]
MDYTFIPRGVCSRKITFEIEGNRVKNVRFAGGCSGNTQGLAALAEGMDADELIERLSGIRCGFKGTSCPDQLAKAVAEAKNK